MLGFPTDINTGTEFAQALHVIFPTGVTAAGSIDDFLVRHFVREVLKHIFLFLAELLQSVGADIIGCREAVYLLERIVQINEMPAKFLG